MTTFSAIVAVCKSFGIGINNTLPWNIKDDLSYFKKLTEGHVVIMGKNTFFSIPEEHRPLKNRINVIVTRDIYQKCFAPYVNDPSVVIMSYNQITFSSDVYKDKEKFVIGGDIIYKMYALRTTKVYLTYIDKDYECDTFYDKLDSSYKLEEYGPLKYDSNENAYYRHLVYNKYMYNDFISCDKPYKSLATKIIEYGNHRADRTGTGTLSIFGHQMRFNMKDEIPILTSKRVPWKSCIEELLWFLRGDTDAKILQEKKVRIWDGNSTREFLDNVGLSHLEEGDCGANYSFQWRHFGAEYIDSKPIMKGWDLIK